MWLMMTVSNDQDTPAQLTNFHLLKGDSPPEVRIAGEPSDEEILNVFDLLTEGLLVSVALFDQLPPPSRRWLVSEFKGCVVTDDVVDIPLLKHAGWLPEFRDGYVVWRAPERSAVREVDAVEFARGLFGPDPLLTVVTGEQPLDDYAVFGELSASRLGGSCALLALSGGHPGDQEVRLGNLAALALDRDTSSNSLSSLTSSGAIKVSAVGASRETSRHSLVLDGFADIEAAEHAWDAAENASWGGYFLLIQVAAVVDPRVGIPPGHIFEQLGMNGVQTLAVASPQAFTVTVGSPQTMVLPAWCLNQNLQAPSGQPVRATPLRARYDSRTSQGGVWTDRARVLAHLLSD